MDACVYRPASTRSPRWTLLSVHGVSRNARQHAEHWAPHAEEHGFLVIAPRFRRQRFADYQRLGAGACQLRADEALLRLLDHFRATEGPLPCPIVLFGYSGGAQFAHRFLLAHPRAADAAVIAAAGWFTFPDPGLKFPRGIAPSPARPDFTAQLDEVLRLPMLVTVGDEDVRADRQLRRRRRLDEQQGETRVERAGRWVRAMEQAAHDRALPSRVSFQIIPGVGHCFSRCMVAGLGDVALRFLTAVRARSGSTLISQ